MIWIIVSVLVAFIAGGIVGAVGVLLYIGSGFTW